MIRLCSKAALCALVFSLICSAGALAQTMPGLATGSGTSAALSSGMTPPPCGRMMPVDLLDRNPGEVWTLLLSGPGGIWESPWLLGCRPAFLLWQDGLSPARQTVQLRYDAEGRVLAWTWEIQNRDSVRALIQAEASYTENGLISRFVQDCPAHKQTNPHATAREERDFAYDAHQRLIRLTHRRPEGCRFEAPTALDRETSYHYGSSWRGQTSQPLPDKLTHLNRQNGAQETHRFTYHRVRGSSQIRRVETFADKKALIAEERYDYDLAGRLTRLTHFDAAKRGQTLRYEYTHDGQISAIRSGQQGRDWLLGYHADGRLNQLEMPSAFPGVPHRSDRLALTAHY